MSGAIATQQGNCTTFKFQTPHCCKKDPVIVDLMPEALPQNRSEDCCRGGLLSPWAIDPSNSFSSLEMKVGNLAGNFPAYKPQNLTLMASGPGYTCGPVLVTDPTVPTVTSDIGGRRQNQHPGFSQPATIYSFNSTVLPTVGFGDEVALFWRIDFNTILLQADGDQPWSPPRHLSVKINVNAVIGPNYSSLALVARDWKGDLVFAYSQKAKTTFPLQAEAEAVRWAISLAAKLEAENVIIETDSKICHDAIHELILPPPWRIASILMDMQSLLEGKARGLITSFLNSFRKLK
ncbi:hypothetical protein SO802_028113 [Lithocarpus litseifolius]|uniref:RNase H type-1 domain-containing protein n=1 Tax=Lithocarpus litseifolius TaxID=425828 RepID=A0AAW2BSX4_9ROSI